MVTSMSSSSSGITSAETPPQKLNLTVTNQQGTRVAYNIGLHTKLRKLMTSHCEKRNLDYNSVRFIYNHQEIEPRQTPAQLKMVEGDEIFVVIEQIGGGPC